MRVDLECGCGAKLTVAYDVGRPYSTPSTEAVAAGKLLEQFRRDHKTCRISKAAT